MPELVQSPDCGLQLTPFFTVISMESDSRSEEELQSIMGMIDLEGSSFWQTDASDETFDSTQVTVKVDIDVGLNIEVSPLTLNIYLEIERVEEEAVESAEEEEDKPTLEFDRSEFFVEPLQCNEEDADWSMKVPPVAEAITEEVTVEWDEANSDFFVYDADESTVYLDPKKKNLVLSGTRCPGKLFINLKFRLSSDLLGSVEEILRIPIFNAAEFD